MSSLSPETAVKRDKLAALQDLPWASRQTALLMMKSMVPPVFIFVGHSGSGKTTMVEKLLPELTARGLRLATIKHAHHKVALDREGKDSWRYKQAGAAMSMLVTADQLQLVADAVDRRDPAQLAERFLGEADMVLAEGFSLAP